MLACYILTALLLLALYLSCDASEGETYVRKARGAINLVKLDIKHGEILACVLGVWWGLTRSERILRWVFGTSLAEGVWTGHPLREFYARAGSRRSISAAVFVKCCFGCCVWVCFAMRGEENNLCKTLYCTLIIIYDFVYHWDLGKLVDHFVILHFISMDFPSWKSRTFQPPWPSLPPASFHTSRSSSAPPRAPLSPPHRALPTCMLGWAIPTARASATNASTANEQRPRQPSWTSHLRPPCYKPKPIASSCSPLRTATTGPLR
jgi:hypothetical protein